MQKNLPSQNIIPNLHVMLITRIVRKAWGQALISAIKTSFNIVYAIISFLLYFSFLCGILDENMQLLMQFYSLL